MRYVQWWNLEANLGVDPDFFASASFLSMLAAHDASSALADVLAHSPKGTMPLDELNNPLPTASDEERDDARAKKREEREADLQLVRQVREGDYGAFETLVKKHQRRVYALALGILKNPTEAEEIVQETFLAAFEKLDGFREEAAFSSWLFRIGTNYALMRLRKKKPELHGDVIDLEGQMAPKADGDEVGTFSAEDTWSRAPDVQAEAQELRSHVSQALASLSEESRAILLLRAYDDMSMQELADTFSLSVPATKSRLHRARLQLKAAMDAHQAERNAKAAQAQQELSAPA